MELCGKQNQIYFIYFKVATLKCVQPFDWYSICHMVIYVYHNKKYHVIHFICHIAQCYFLTFYPPHRLGVSACTEVTWWQFLYIMYIRNPVSVIILTIVILALMARNSVNQKVFFFDLLIHSGFITNKGTHNPVAHHCKTCIQ